MSAQFCLQRTRGSSAPSNLILIFYAFSREVSALKRRLGNRTPLNLTGLSGFRIRAQGGEVAFVATGIGMKRARAIARQALTALPETELVIATGVVGALSGGLRPGDIVIADRAIRARADSSHPEQVLAVDAALVDRCERALHRAGLASSTGAILTSMRVIPNALEKRSAKQNSGAIAVDMESAAIAIEATARGLPFAIVRTVIDSLEDEIFGAELADDEGRVKPLATANYLVRNPGAFLKIPWMLRNLSLATRALAEAIEVLIDAGSPTHEGG
jgi:adenosylhomocysteine nucleosidase